MGGRSTIKRLPPAVQELIGELRREGRTIDEILGKLGELRAAGAHDQEISRSALGRHVKEIEQLGRELRESKVIADALVAGLGDEPENRVTRLNIQLAHNVLFKLFRAATTGEATMDAEEAMFAASSIQKLTAAAKSDADLTMKLQAEADRKAVAAMETAAKRQGLSADMIAAIKRDFLGIRQPSP